MAVAKVILNGSTLMDVTQDTVTSSTLLSTYTATKADGTKVNGAYVAPSFSVQSKTATPTESDQTIIPDSGYDGLSAVTIYGISSNYIGTNVARKSSADLIASGSIISGPVGYYSEAFSKAVSAGSISLSGTTISLSVTPTLTSANGKININYQNTAKKVSAIVTSGYISSNVSSALNITASGSLQLPSLAAQTITPTTTDQTIAWYQWLTGSQTILGDANLLASNIASGVSIFGVVGTFEGGGPSRSAADITATGSVVSGPAGTYSEAFSKAIDAGSVTQPYISVTVNPDFAITTSTGVINVFSSTNKLYTPTLVSGYISSINQIQVRFTATSVYYYQSLISSTTYTPTTTDQILSSGYLLTGSQTILGDANLLASNIASGVSIFGVVGTFEGGGSGGHDVEDAIITRTLSGYYMNDRVSIIGSYAFISNKQLTEVYFPECISIYEGAFSFCTSLESFSFPKCKYFGSYAFKNDIKISSITSDMFYSCRYFGQEVFAMCQNISTVNIVNTMSSSQYYLTSSATGLFSNCKKLESVYMDNITFIPSSCFCYCDSLANVFIPSATNVAASAFYSTALTQVTNSEFPVLRDVGNHAFDYCSFISIINLQNTISGVASYGFANCYSLTSVILSGPSTFNRLAASAFHNCSNLETIYIEGKNMSIESNPFTSCSKLKSVEIRGSFQSNFYFYLNTFSGANNIEYVSIPDYSKPITNNIFYQKRILKTVYIPLTTGINNDAFNGCSSLESAIFPECTYISGNTFAYCIDLSIISMPKTLSISTSAFYGCSKLLEVSFPSCTFIGANAFIGCESLSAISFPECISISRSAFYNCSALMEASFPKATDLLYDYIFDGCSALSVASFPVATGVPGYAFFSCCNLETAYFPAASKIEYSAFRGCYNLVSIDFTSCKSIGAYAFYECSNLETVIFPNVSIIGNYAFSGCSNLMNVCLLSESIVSISQNASGNIFRGTGIQYSKYIDGEWKYGSIYVPESLVSSYQVATNWAGISSRITAYVSE